jgi:hypothetical protein
MPAALRKLRLDIFTFGPLMFPPFYKRKGFHTIWQDMEVYETDTAEYFYSENLGFLRRKIELIIYREGLMLLIG